MNVSRSIVVGWSLALVVGSIVGCGDHEHGREGTPTGSVCATDSTLTYENFGRPFMENYCVRCHSSELSGAERHGAPEAHDFDTLSGILLVAEHVDEYAAAGPNATNTIMPPNGDHPNDVERQQLGEWLACELQHVADAGDDHDGGHDLDAGHQH